jgi:sRNA-binding protein
MDQTVGEAADPVAESKARRGKREFAEGRRAAKRIFPQLRARYPAAFPTETALVRPLVGSANQQIAEDFGFPLKFVRGLLFNWKRSEAYCRAVLTYPVRITLDGAVDPEMGVDDQARRMARQELDRNERRRAARKAAEAAALAETAPAVASAAPEPAQITPAFPAAPEPPPPVAAESPTPVAPARKKLTLKAPINAEAIAHTTTRTVRTIEVPESRGKTRRR